MKPSGCSPNAAIRGRLHHAQDRFGPRLLVREPARRAPARVLAARHGTRSIGTSSATRSEARAVIASTSWKNSGRRGRARARQPAADLMARAAAALCELLNRRAAADALEPGRERRRLRDGRRLGGVKAGERGAPVDAGEAARVQHVLGARRAPARLPVGDRIAAVAEPAARTRPASACRAPPAGTAAPRAPSQKRRFQRILSHHPVGFAHFIAMMPRSLFESDGV